ncbi:helix-turn-helix domain containing protein [Phenylobacterium sp. LjRoot219]|uniref:TetR/AcrR family transcriptional regulator n=1 Tax=Phenylobacterium sp. LjRoot219 TaxID=3342283 RepID=UPI003ECC3581
MTSERRNGEESARTRTAILDATAQIMREEGYAAVSSRKVAERAGLKSQLVHYHFGTMDELFLALYQRYEQQHFARHAQALASRNPLRALWDLSVDAAGAELSLEFIALANHRKAIRKEIARSTERYRSLQVAVVSRFAEDLALSPDDMPADVLCFLMVATSRALITEAAVGVSAGHASMRAYIERQLQALEARTPKA